MNCIQTRRVHPDVKDQIIEVIRRILVCVKMAQVCRTVETKSCRVVGSVGSGMGKRLRWERGTDWCVLSV